MSHKEIFTKAYLDYYNEIHRMCYLYLKDYHLAEDATSETFIRVYQNINGFKSESSLKTWIIRIAINVCKDMIRKGNHNGTPCAEIDTSLEGVTFDKTDSLLNQCVLSEAIMELKKELREVIILYYYMELNSKEIASILRLPQTTVKFRLRKAKDELKSLLKGDFTYE